MIGLRQRSIIKRAHRHQRSPKRYRNPSRINNFQENPIDGRYDRLLICRLGNKRSNYRVINLFLNF